MNSGGIDLHHNWQPVQSSYYSQYTTYADIETDREAGKCGKDIKKERERTWRSVIGCDIVAHLFGDDWLIGWR